MISFKYRDYLQGAAINAKNPERTRLRLKIATAQVLELKDYHSMSVHDICEQSGVSRPAFYAHFSNKEDIVVELISELSELERQLMPALTGAEEPFDAWTQIARWYVTFAYQNRELWHNSRRLEDTIPEIDRIADRRSEQLKRHIFSLLQSHFDAEEIDDRLGVILDVVGAGITRLVRLIGSQRYDAEVIASEDLEPLIELVALMFYRGMYGKNPDGELLTTTRSLLDYKLK